MAKWDDGVQRCRRERNTKVGPRGSFQANTACGMPRPSASIFGGPTRRRAPIFRGGLPGGWLNRRGRRAQGGDANVRAILTALTMAGWSFDRVADDSVIWTNPDGRAADENDGYAIYPAEGLVLRVINDGFIIDDEETNGSPAAIMRGLKKLLAEDRRAPPVLWTD